MNNQTIRVEMRDRQDSDEWRDASWLAAESVTNINTHLYGWEKFRVTEEA